MKNLLKVKIVKVFILFIYMTGITSAQDVTTINAASEEISDNLDLEAVASILGDSKDLEEFEYKLNDPETQISNLDLNEDGNVDYLRVVETAENDTHVIALQSVLGEDVYQDVATIEVEKDSKGKTRVQLVGDVYLYGPSYIVEPVYVHRPAIFSIFWKPYYRPYRSVFYWGYYPSHHYFWKPFKIHNYKKHVHLHINMKHKFHYTHVRYSTTAVHIHTKTRRNDFAVRHPQKAYTARRVTRVNNANGTKKRATAVHQADGDKYRVAGVNKADGTKKRAAGVNKADGTKKRAATVKKADGSRKTVAVKKNPDGSKRAVAVNKSSDGTRTVKTATKKSGSSKVKTKSKRTKKKVTKGK